MATKLYKMEINRNNLQLKRINFKSAVLFQCRKQPCEVCGPEKCPITTGTVCEDKEKTVKTQNTKVPKISDFQFFVI
jgi:hypothetical protein